MITPGQKGPWVYNSNGRFMGAKVIAYAISYGYNLEKNGYILANATPDNDRYSDLTKAAVLFMNTLAPKGFYFGVQGGDWGLWEVERSVEFVVRPILTIYESYTGNIEECRVCREGEEPTEFYVIEARGDGSEKHICECVHREDAERVKKALELLESQT